MLPSSVSLPFLFCLTILGWYFHRVCRLTDLMNGNREQSLPPRFANLRFLPPFFFLQKQYIPNIYIDTFVKRMKYIYWQAQVRITLYYFILRSVSSYKYEITEMEMPAHDANWGKWNFNAYLPHGTPTTFVAQQQTKCSVNILIRFKMFSKIER